MLTNLSENNKKINFTGLNEVTKRTVRTFHPSSEELTALRQNYAEKEILFAQGPIDDCYLIAALKSIMFGLNEYAGKTNRQSYNARNWLKKLVVKDNKGNAEVFFPVLKKLEARLPVSKLNINRFKGSKGNEKIDFLEYGYGILTKWTDLCKRNKQSITKVLDWGISSLAIRDVTGLKAGQVKNKKTEELFKKYTGKLFKKFQKSPESLILTASTKTNVPKFFIGDHAYSIKKVIADGLTLVDPLNKTNEEINISLDDFYKYFANVNFARLRPEKMFKMIEETKKTTQKASTLKLSVKANFEPIRDSSTCYRNKGHVFIEDDYND